MDLYAYANIENLDEIAKRNGIEVPRLRGYRLMKDEEPIDIRKEIDKDYIAYSTCKELCQAQPYWNPNAECWELSSWTNYLTDFYTNPETKTVRWERIHGWKRKVLKFAIKKQIKAQTRQWEMFNKYCGREDVLYIHSRIGGGNWNYFNGNELLKKDWFLDKIDDSFDCTYCDIYAKIKPEEELNG